MRSVHHLCLVESDTLCTLHFLVHDAMQAEIMFVDRLACLQRAASKIQAVVKSYLARKLFLRQKRAAILLQAFVRGRAAMKHVSQVRAAVVLQKIWRRYRTEQTYRALRQAIISIQVQPAKANLERHV